MKILEKIMTDKKISVYSKLAFSYLYSISGKNWTCSKPRKEIAKEINISIRTLDKHLKILASWGHIRVCKNLFHSNIYILDSEQPEKRMNLWR